MKSFLFTAVVSILFTFSLIAQPIQMNPLNGPEGGTVSKFHLNSQGDIIAVQNRVGTRISRDGGDTWQTPNGAFSTSRIAVHPDGSFYGKGNFSEEIYKIPPTSVDAETIKFDSLNNSTLNDFTIDEIGNFYGTSYDDEIFRSLDGGKTWDFLRKKGWGTAGFQKMYSPPGDHIYFKVKGGVFLQELIYRMRKDNFEFELSFNSTNDRIYTFCENPTGGYFLNNLSGVYYSSDGSSGSWTKISSGFQTVALACADNENLTVAALSGYYQTSDLGMTWTQLPGPDVSQFVGVVTMDYDAAREKYYIRNQSSDLFNFYKVEPDLSNWEPIVPEKNQPPVNKVLTDGAGNIYAGIALSLGSEIEGFYRSEDGGDTFSPYLLPNGSEIRSIAEGANEILFAFGYNDTIYRSSDYGMNWTPTMPNDLQINPQDPTSSRFSYVKASADGTVLANFGNGIYRLWISEDNGDTWAKLSPQSFYKTHIDIHPSGDIYGSFFQNNNGKLVVKYDRQTALWDTIYTDGGSITGMTVSETGLILARKNGEYLISEDEGATFFPTGWNFNYVTSAANGYLVGAQGSTNLMLSKNNGLSWEVAYTYTGAGTYRDFHFDKNNILYAAFDGDFIHKSGQIIFEDNFIVGNVFYDENENCNFETDEMPLDKIIVAAEGLDTFFVTTRSDGRFVIPVPVGDYDVSISMDFDLWMPCDSLQSVTLTGISDTAFIDFPVKPKTLCPKLSIDISTPRLRRCFQNTYHVNYCNDGTIPATDAFVTITLDPRITIVSSQIPWSNQTGSSYTFDLGDVEIFTCGDFSFVTEMDCDQVDLGETICAEANIFPDTICAPPAANWSLASLDVSVECIGDSAIFTIKNVGSGNMIESRNYIIIEDFVIMRQGGPFQLDAGQEEIVTVETMGQTIHLETQQVAGHPGQSRPSSTIEKCGAQPHSFGFYNQYGHNDANSTVDIECQEVIGAYDPNDKNAVPTGRATERFVQSDGQIEYLIRFQNTGTDTAFTVQIFDTLSRNLDIKSFRAVGASHDFDYEISDRGILKFKFENIMLPDSFVNQVASNGFIKYKIAMKSGLIPSEEILNTADIYFDYNGSIRTNTTLHTIEEEWVLVKTGEVFLPKSEVKIYPNPFSESAILELQSENFKGEFTCQIFDLNGRLIWSQNSDSQQVMIERHQMKMGIYFYKIENSEGAIASGKLIVK